MGALFVESKALWGWAFKGNRRKIPKTCGGSDSYFKNPPPQKKSAMFPKSKVERSKPEALSRLT